MSRFFCLWIPGFAAWAAAYLDPTLRHRPVVVHTGDRVIAASPQVGALGVSIGWTVNRTRSYLLSSDVQETVFLAHHGTTTQAAWEAVLAEMAHLTPRLESVRPGLAFADLRPPSCIEPLLHDWNLLGAKKEGYGVRGGLANDRATAELVARTAMPGEMSNVAPGGEYSFRRDVPLSVLAEAGLAIDTLQQMALFGWNFLGDLAKVEEKHLVLQFGKEGRQAAYYLKHDDRRPLSTYRPPAHIEARFAFDEAIREPCEATAVLAMLVDHLLEKLGDQRTRWLCLHLGETRSCRVHLKPAAPGGEALASARQQQRHLLEILTRSLQELWLEKPGVIDSIRVRLEGLEDGKGVQHALFDMAPSSPTATSAPPRALVEAMERRFPGALLRIVMREAAYLPEEGFRFEPVSAIEKEEGRAKTKRGKARKSSLLQGSLGLAV